MVNLLITMRCNRACSYCFAKEKIDSYLRLTRSVDITIQDTDKVLDFLVKGGCNALQLAGGEPTIHPKFDEILIRILRRDMYVNLLSNALWNREKNALFSKITPTKLGFLLNIDYPNTYKSSEWRRVEENLTALQGRWNVSLSFNIFEKEPKHEYIFDLLSRYGFKNLRLSFSMPVVFGRAKNIFLPIEDYRDLAPFIMDFVRRARSLDAFVSMDNTVPICMFSQDELGELLLDGVLEPHRNFICFPAIDIGPDLSMWRCFGTSGLFNRRLEEFNSLYEVYEYYERVSRLYQAKVFAMDKCYECKYAREGICQGGCMGFSVAKCVELGNCPKEITDKDILDMKPKLKENVAMEKYEIPRSVLILLENKKFFEVHPSMKDLLDLFDGKRTVRKAISKWRKISMISGTGDPLDTFLTNVASEEVIPTIRRLLDKELLVIQGDNGELNSQTRGRVKSKGNGRR